MIRNFVCCIAFTVAVFFTLANAAKGQSGNPVPPPNGYVQTAGFEICSCGLGASCDCDFAPGCGLEPTCECYEAPACGCDLVEPGCAVISDGGCLCGEPSCGLYSEPTCAFANEPTCAFPTEPTCACGAPTCGLPGYPACGLEVVYEPSCACGEPSCGLYGEPTCQIATDPLCDCGEPTCGLYGEPTCGLLGAPMCDCGSMISEPLCGCDQAETSFGLREGGILRGGRLPKMPGWLNWKNLSGRKWLTIPSSHRESYFSIGFGLSESTDEARHIGTTANTFGGTPLYDIQSGALGRIGLGVDLGEVRLETELGFRRNSVDLTRNGVGNRSSDAFSVDGARTSTTIMFNGYCDLENSTFVTPYFKAGLGVSRNEVQADLAVDVNSPTVINALGLTGPSTLVGQLPRNTSTEIAWQLGVGLTFDLTRIAKFDCEYQYLDIGDSATAFDANGDALSFAGGGVHELTFGVRFNR